MRKEIRNRFNENLLAEIAARYGARPGDLDALDGFESFIYRYQAGGEGRILRIGHSGRRGEAYVRGEMDWLRHLHAGGAGVAMPILSAAGNPVETVADGQGEHFIAAAFQEAPGRFPDEFGWSDSLYKAYGRLIGRTHALTIDYQPQDPLARRPSWDGADVHWIPEVLAKVDPIALEKWEGVLAAARTLPQPEDAYGLVHFDAHGANFFVDDDGAITLFDFDDCCYSWFAADIAIVLFYKVMWAEDMPAATRAFLIPFLRGYREEYTLDPDWLDTIPLFLKMREIDLYALIHRDFDVETMKDPWNLGFMKHRKARIQAGQPYIDLDFDIFRGDL